MFYFLWHFSIEESWVCEDGRIRTLYWRNVQYFVTPTVDIYWELKISDNSLWFIAREQWQCQDSGQWLGWLGCHLLGLRDIYKISVVVCEDIGRVGGGNGECQVFMDPDNFTTLGVWVTLLHCQRSGDGLHIGLNGQVWVILGQWEL